MFRFCIFILIFSSVPALEVRFKESYPTHNIVYNESPSNLHKRDMQQFYDKATFTFNGLNRVASVPVAYPLDICILQLPTAKFATSLHKNQTGQKHFAVFAWREGEYNLMMEVSTPLAVALDCMSYAGRGYVALTYNLTQSIGHTREGSPIYEVSAESGIRTVQYFATNRLRAMYLRMSSQEMTLLQAHDTSTNEGCPYFKWTGRTFQRLGSIPCSNARRLEPFGVDYSDYVAVANYADANGKTATHSEIYKYNVGTRRFDLFQRLRSNGAVDIKYFSVPVNEASRRHFLILGNTVSRAGDDAEADSVFYVYDKTQFVPYQRLSFFNVERFLPVPHSLAEKFLLLVACKKQDVKIYNLNDWKFEESNVQFTEGAFSRGVARMRSYEEGDQSYLVIANELMTANETNIFQPLYKQDEHANALRQEIIDWAQAQTKRLQGFKVEELLKKLQDKHLRLNQPTIKRVKTKSLVDDHLKLNSNYWDALHYAKRALDVIERQVKATKRSKRQAHEFDEISVGTLVVRDSLKTTRLNGVNVEEPIYESINVSKVYVSGDYEVVPGPIKTAKMEELHVNELQLEGQLNGLKWKHFLEQTLKRNGSEVQFIKSPAIISNLEADAVVVNSHEINGQNLNQLVSTEGGHYVVQQDIQFAAPIKVNRLEINQRLNNIYVDYHKRFNVLLKETSGIQVIEGTKRMENVRALEPITMAGQMLGAELRAMTPMKVTHKALYLQGDYVINEDVIVGNILRAKDLVEHQSNKSTAQAFRRGIRLGKGPLEEVNLRFEQPLRANHTELSFINAQDLQHLVRLMKEGEQEVQVIRGTKWLPQSLQVTGGFGEVKWLNGVDVEELPGKLFLKEGNQTIKVPLHFGGITVKEVEVQPEQVKLNGHPLRDYLSFSGNQVSNSTLFVQNLHTPRLQVEQLNTNEAIFGHKLSDIYQHGRKSAGEFSLPRNFTGTLYARNLWLKTHLNNVSVAELEQQLQQLAGNIKYVGDFHFQHPVNISNLNFGETLNGIPAKDFGNCWLESSGDQVFTAPQKVAAMHSIVQGGGGVQLKGRLNNRTLEEYVSSTYKLNGSEQLPSVKFENPIVLKSGVMAGKVNGLRVPEDMLSSKDQLSILQGPVKVNGSLLVSSLCNASWVNGLPLKSLRRYLKGGFDTLHLENLELAEVPNYATLNGYSLQHLLDEVWLANEPITLGVGGQRVHLKSSTFEGLLDFEGSLNGRDLGRVEQSYFSRTRSQQVNVQLNFRDDVTFAQPLTASNVRLRGNRYIHNSEAIVEGIGNGELNFDSFVSNTLKTAGAHNITGQWSMLEAYVPGDLQNVHVNQLNLVDDVLRRDSESIPLITGLKTVPSAVVKHLNASATSSVATVPVARWIRDAAYIYGNNSIAGTTIVEAVNLYNDLKVNGPVNGVHWHPKQLLLRDQDQHFEGRLRVENTVLAQQRILTHNIAELWVDNINGHQVNELLTNQARNRPNLHVKNQVIFTQPLTVGNVEVVPSYKWKRGVNEFVDNWQVLEENLDYVEKRLNEPLYVLENFKLIQHIPLNASQVEILAVEKSSTEVMAISYAQTEKKYFVWQPNEHIFRSNSNLTRLHLKTVDSVRCQLPTKSLPASPLANAKQLLLLADTNRPCLLGVLRQHVFELWHWQNGTLQLHSHLIVPQANHMALAGHNDGVYLALLTATGVIQIYSSSANHLAFKLEQTIELEDAVQTQPHQLHFLQLTRSNDLLLFVVSKADAPRQPLQIYQLQGVIGFQLLVGSSTLPAVQSLHTLSVEQQQRQLLALIGRTQVGVFVVEPQFKLL